MHPLLAFLLGAITVVGFAALLAAIWLVVAGDRVDEHWPIGLDEPPLLDVQNHVGDSRPIR